MTGAHRLTIRVKRHLVIVKCGDTVQQASLRTMEESRSQKSCGMGKLSVTAVSEATFCSFMGYPLTQKTARRRGMSDHDRSFDRSGFEPHKDFHLTLKHMKR